MLPCPPRRVVLLLVFCALWLGGCGGSGGPGGPTIPTGPNASQPDVNLPGPPPDTNQADYELKDNVVVVGEGASVGSAQGGGVRVMTQSAGREIVLQGAVPELEPGDVLVSQLGGGFLGKVLAVETLGGSDGNRQVRVRTDAATLQDVFKRADLRFVKTLGPEDLVEVVPLQQGVTVRCVEPSGRFPVGVSKELVLDLGHGVEVSATVGLQVTVVFDFELSYDCWDPLGFGWSPVCYPDGIRYFESSVYVKQSSELKLSATAAAEIEREKPLAEARFGPYAVGPVLITPKIELCLGGKVGLEASFETSVSYEITAWAGARYRGGQGWTPIYGWNWTRDWQRPELTLKAYAEAWLAVKPAIWIYETLGPKMVLRAFAECVMSCTLPSSSPKITLDLYLGASIGVEFEIEILGCDIATPYNKPDLWSHKWPILHREFPLYDDGGGGGGPPQPGGEGHVIISALPPGTAGPSPPGRCSPAPGVTPVSEGGRET